VRGCTRDDPVGEPPAARCIPEHGPIVASWSGERSLEPRDVPVAEPNLRPCSVNLPTSKPETAIQRDRDRVSERDPRDGAVKVLSAQRLEKLRVQRRADPASCAGQHRSDVAARG